MIKYIFIVFILNYSFKMICSDLIFNIREINCLSKKKYKSFSKPCSKFKYLINKYYNGFVICQESNTSSIMDLFNCYPTFDYFKNDYKNGDLFDIHVNYILIKTGNLRKLDVEASMIYHNFETIYILVFIILFIYYNYV